MIAVALLPVEAVFWIGFALPIPSLLGIARVVLIALAWRSLFESNACEVNKADQPAQPGRTSPELVSDHDQLYTGSWTSFPT